MQIVETSYAYGFETLTIEKKDWSIAVLIRQQAVTQQDLEQYCAVLAAILSEERFSVLLYNGVQVQYQIIYDQRRAEIYKYVVRNEICGNTDENSAQKKKILASFQRLWQTVCKRKKMI